MGWFNNDDDDLIKKRNNKVDEVEEEEETEEDEPELYDVDIECNNCGSEETYEIDFGKRWKDEMKGKKCEYCGCMLVEEEPKTNSKVYK